MKKLANLRKAFPQLEDLDAKRRWAFTLVVVEALDRDGRLGEFSYLDLAEAMGTRDDYAITKWDAWKLMAEFQALGLILKDGGGRYVHPDAYTEEVTS